MPKESPASRGPGGHPYIVALASLSTFALLSAHFLANRSKSSAPDSAPEVVDSDVGPSPEFISRSTQPTQLSLSEKNLKLKVADWPQPVGAHSAPLTPPPTITTGTAHSSPAASAESALSSDLTSRKSSLLWTRPLGQLPPSHMALSGKVVLVTGGTRGIGAAIAHKLAQEGARVAFTFSQASSVQNAHMVISSIEAVGSSATAIQADVTRDPERVVKHALKAFGVDKLDILVNNAGARLDALMEETTQEEYDAVFETNARAVFFMMQAARPHLEIGGRIINLSAAAAKGDDMKSMAFAGSKAAVEAFTRVAAREFDEQGKGVTVNCVAPGRVSVAGEASLAGHLERGLAGENPVRVEDVADVVAFLAGDGAKSISGSVIPVTGGRMATS